MAIDTTDKLVAGLFAATAQGHPFWKASVTTEGAGTIQSLWKVAGCPGAGVNPPTGAGHSPTSATAGALRITNAGGANKLFVADLTVASSVQGTPRLYDRLVATSGLSGTLTTAQTVNSTAFTRGDTTGKGVELWLEFYAAIGATAATLTVTYTNQDGATGRTGTYIHPANAETVGQMVQVQLQSGDTGVRSVQSVQWSVSTGTAGDFGITLARTILEVGVQQAAAAGQKDSVSGAGAQIDNDACLALMNFGGSGTSSGLIQGRVQIREG
jgi:hypothetical protein